MPYYAHSAPDADESRWQTLPDHSVQTAGLASKFAADFGGERPAYLAGLLHDLGKYNPEFLAYIREPARRGGKGPDHSTDGAGVLLRAAASAARPIDRAVLELLAHAVAGHHAGLPDRMRSVQEASASALQERLERWDDTRLDPVWQDELSADFSALFPPGFRMDPRKASTNPAAAPAFQIAFLGRMLFSCLVDADFKDTETYYNQLTGLIADRNWPALQDVLPELRARFDREMASKAATSGKLTSLRGEILAHVRGRAAEPAGVFTLNVPTGGGKTLASLGFALDHAAQHDHRRIIYAIPFTSIIDQTAAIFRHVLGDEMILEHHSAIEEESLKALGQRDKLKLAMEDWAAPVVVTTNVQLFESLFANRPGRCRKLHNIARSIIILDEAQTLPLPYLKPSVLALDELARNYGCTIVLCTATQPALDRRDFPAGSLMGLELDNRELAPDPARLARELRRTTIRRAGVLSDDDLVRDLADHPRALVIVNSRKHALELFSSARAAGLEGLVHLSTRQCAAHRQALLARVREKLQGDGPCRVVATSLIEAGVDVDFPRVYRAEAGLDQVLQAAGRCNREGSRAPDDSHVLIFKPEVAQPPEELAQFAAAFASIERRHTDLFSPEAIRDYFQEVYWQRGANDGKSGLDAKGILTMARMDKSGTNIAYRKIADAFRMIESGMLPVIIPYDDHARHWIGKLDVESVPSGQIARELQRSVVQVPLKVRTDLIANGAATVRAADLRADQFVVLTEASRLYTPEVGLWWETAGALSTEDLLW